MCVCVSESDRACVRCVGIICECARTDQWYVYLHVCVYDACVHAHISCVYIFVCVCVHNVCVYVCVYVRRSEEVKVRQSLKWILKSQLAVEFTV